MAGKRHHEHSNSYKRKQLSSGLPTISEDWSIIIVAGRMGACRCVVRAVAKGFTHWPPISGQEERAALGLVWAFQTSQPTPSDTPPLTKTHLLTLPNSSPAGDERCKYMSLWGQCYFHSNHYMYHVISAESLTFWEKQRSFPIQYLLSS